MLEICVVHRFKGDFVSLKNLMISPIFSILSMTLGINMFCGV